jgi:hypothetical protein
MVVNATTVIAGLPKVWWLSLQKKAKTGMLPHGYGYPHDSWKLHISGSIPRWLDEFPDVATAAINTLIRKEHAGFETSQIRDFVPLLVEKHPRRELKH